MTSDRRILVYAPINYTIVDGSAIWLRSICKVLSLIPETRVDLLAFAAPTDLQEPLDGPRQVFLPSMAMFTNSGLPALAQGQTLPPAAAVDALAILQEIETYDYLLVRGTEAAATMAGFAGRKPRLISYLTDIEPELLWEDPEGSEHLARLQLIAERSALMFVQTRELGALIEELAPAASPKIVPLPPMVPDHVFSDAPRRRNTPLRMVYAGKFATEWAIEELLDLARDHAGTEPGREAALDVHIYGDKFNRSDDGFQDRVQARLRAPEGFTWHGAVSRDTILARLGEYDLGYAYRHNTLMGNPEISTKLIEYAAAGCAPILNRSPAHEAYFGADYPLFADSPEELARVTDQAIAGAVDLEAALRHAKGQIAPHRMSNVARMIGARLAREEPIALRPAAASALRPNLLVVSHDRKFMGDLEQALLNPRNFQLSEVRWPGFRGGGEAETAAALPQAHVIFCEWALENAVFCSRHKRPGQKLIVRFHRFELTTGIPQRIEIDNVDMVVTVSDHMAEHLHQTYGWPREKIRVIPNSIDSEQLDRRKTDWAGFNLGLLGPLPKLKRLDLAAELLEILRQRDPRFQLHVKGKMPWQLPWLWNSGEQFSHYNRLFDLFRRNAHLRGAVHVDDHAPDVPRWFQKIGWILSLSDVESFHLAGVEGMASGAIPLVLDRPGAAHIFPQEQIFPDIEAIAAHVLDRLDQAGPEGAGLAESRAAMKASVRRFDKAEVMRHWADLLRAEG